MLNFIRVILLFLRQQQKAQGLLVRYKQHLAHMHYNLDYADSQDGGISACHYASMAIP